MWKFSALLQTWIKSNIDGVWIEPVVFWRLGIVHFTNSLSIYFIIWILPILLFSNIKDLLLHLKQRLQFYFIPNPFRDEFIKSKIKVKKVYVY